MFILYDIIEKITSKSKKMFLNTCESNVKFVKIKFNYHLHVNVNLLYPYVYHN